MEFKPEEEWRANSPMRGVPGDNINKLVTDLSADKSPRLPEQRKKEREEKQINSVIESELS